MTKLLNADGTELVLHRHMDGQGTITFESRQDVAPILDNTKALHNEGKHGSSEMKLAASFPRVLIDKYCADNNITFSEWMGSKEHKRRMLNDPDLKSFRIWPGRV